MNQKNGLCFRMWKKTSLKNVIYLATFIFLSSFVLGFPNSIEAGCLEIYIDGGGYAPTGIYRFTSGISTSIRWSTLGYAGWVRGMIGSDQLPYPMGPCILPPDCPEDISSSSEDYCLCPYGRVYKTSEGGTCGNFPPHEEFKDRFWHATSAYPTAGVLEQLPLNFGNLKIDGFQFWAGTVFVKTDGNIKFRFDKNSVTLRVTFTPLKTDGDGFFYFDPGATPIVYEKNNPTNNPVTGSLFVPKGLYYLEIGQGATANVWRYLDNFRFVDDSNNEVPVDYYFAFLHGDIPVTWNPFLIDLRSLTAFLMEICQFLGYDWNENAPVGHQCCGDDGYDDFYSIGTSATSNKYFCHKYESGGEFKWKWHDAETNDLKIYDVDRLLNLKYETSSGGILEQDYDGIAFPDLKFFLETFFGEPYNELLFGPITGEKVKAYRDLRYLYDNPEPGGYNNFPPIVDEGTVDEIEKDVATPGNQFTSKIYEAIAATSNKWYACQPIGEILWPEDFVVPLYSSLADEVGVGSHGDPIITFELGGIGDYLQDKYNFDLGSLEGATSVCGANCVWGAVWCLDNHDNCDLDPNCEWKYIGEPVNGELCVVREEITGYENEPNHESYYCYDRDGAHLFGECCANSQDKCVNPSDGFKLGAPLESIQNFDFSTPEAGFKDYILKAKFEGGSASDRFLLLPVIIYDVLIIAEHPNPNFFDFKIRDWRYYSSLEFDIAWSVHQDLTIEFTEDDEVDDDPSHWHGALQLSDYSHNGGGPMKWHHISIPITTIQSQTLANNPPDQITGIKITAGPSGTFAMVLDNIYLKRYDNNNPVAEYCSGERKWVTELDAEGDPTGGACKAQLAYAWTGGEGQKGCCGDDKNIHAEPPTTEYFNVLVSDGGTGVACWDGSGIFNNKRVSDVLLTQYPYILNFDGQFYNCNDGSLPNNIPAGFSTINKSTCENPYNLIKNPGFETSSNWNGGTRVTNLKFKGTYSLKLQPGQTATQSFYAQEGIYAIKLWVNKIGTADLNLKINGFQHTMIYKTTVNNWELYTNYGEFNPDSSGDFNLELSNQGSGGLFVDEVVVMQDLGKVYHCSVDNEWDELSYVNENGMPTNEPGEIGEISDLRDSKKFTPEPITSGCCPDNYCFKKEGSDDKCVKQYPDESTYENIFYEPIDPNNPPLSVYACIDGSWATREKRLSYHTPPFWGYCPGANQCYKGTAGNNNPDECVDEGTIQYDEDTYIYYYCSQGTWTQTELIIHPPPDGEYYSCNLAPTDPLLDLTDPDTGELYLGQYGERNLGHCETPNNLIKNNGFELETNLWSTSGTTFTNRIYGQKSLRLTNSQSAEQQFTTLNAETHQFKVWYKGDKNNIDVQIFGEYEISQEISNANKEASNDLGEWKLYTGEVELSSQTNYKIKILSTGGTIYIDDVAVYYDILNSDGSFEYVCDVDNSWQLPNILGSGGSFLIDNLKDTLKLGIGLVGNGGFENGQHAYFYSESESHGEYSIITGNAHSGPFSLKLHSTGTNPVHTNQVEYQIDIPGSLFIPGETYTYSLWAKLGFGSGTDTRVTHGRLHYSDCANVFWNGQGPTSTSWQRLSHTFTVDPNCDLYLLALYIGYAGETDGWVGNRYVDDIQIERNSEPTPYKQSGNGCCPASYCWDGTECKENRAVSNNYLCLNGAWDFAVVKWNPSHTYSTTKCAATECYDGPPEPPDKDCVGINTYIEDTDHYCEGIYDNSNNLVGAEWTSRTKKIALQFLKFIQNPSQTRYTLFCDDKENALNYDDEIVVGVNNFCVLKYGTSENNVAFGTTFDTDALPSFLANLGIGQNYCDGVLNQLDGQFHKCSGDKRVWYNPSLNAIIYAKNQITLNYIVDWWQAFINWLRNLFLGIIDTGQTIDFVNQQPFNRLYIYQDNEGKTIRGITGKVDADKFVYVEYIGFIDVCEKINAIYPATTLCVDNVVDIDQTTYNNINNNLPGEEDVWKDLTSKLRIDPDTYTLSSTTTTTMPDSCTDSDGGNEPYTVGITSGYFGGSSYSYTDYCINSAKLTEYYCSGTTSTSTIHTCPYYGMECINGQCVYPGTTTLPT